MNATTLQNANELIAALSNRSLTEIARGVFLQTSQALISEQNEWDDADPSKGVDFSAYPYWITTDDGQNPEGIRDAEELAEFLEKNGL